MLVQRVITAVVLLLILAAAISAPGPWPLIALLSLMFACAYWEWLRLVPCSNNTAWLGAVSLLVLFGLLSLAVISQQAYVAIFFTTIVIPLSLLFWLMVAPAMVRSASVGASWRPWMLLLTGAVCMLAAWYGLVWTFVFYGVQTMISLWALVWIADSAAYFVGRRFGQRKLAPKVSPNKTLEGGMAGVLAGVLWFIAGVFWWPDSYAAVVFVQHGWVLVIVSAVLLSIWSIVGDLFESLLKRRLGVKDSGVLLPGHGGVYDRIDAILPVAPAALLLLSGTGM